MTEPRSNPAAGAAPPLQRFGTKDDVAQFALFLASPAAKYVTGSIHSVDGGMALCGGRLIGM